jgi:Uma2 family endonuclease
MRDAHRNSAAARLAVDEFYPSSDGQPMAETEIHVLLILNTFGLLRYFFRDRGDVYVAANMFLYYKQGHPEKRRAPDIMVVKGVDGRRKRRSFKTWEENAVPRTVIEFTSDETAAEDQGPKKRLYRALRVREYFLFDPLHDYLPRPLVGYRLVDGRYRRMVPDAEGGLVSEELGLRLVPEGDDLAVYDLKSGRRILGPFDIPQALDRVEQELQKEKAERQKEQQRAAELEKQLKQLRRVKKRKKR